jgi:hypothetical protein
MKEMNINSTNQGVQTMKKSLFVVAVAAMLVFAFAGSAFAAYATVGSDINVGGAGYIAWSSASGSTFDAAAQNYGPHGDYTTNSLKCAVCHSVHGASSSGIALTKVPNSLTQPSQICAYCHGIGTTVTNKIVSVGYLTGTDHTAGGCANGCHASSVHGADTSVYASLASRLLNNRADIAIAAAITATAKTGLTNAIMNDVNAGQSKAMATAYTCGGDAGGLCHGNSAFGVMQQGKLENTNANGWKTGHPVWQGASNDWSQSGALFGTPASAFDGTVAYADAFGCAKCHDITDAARGGATAFPHNQQGGSVLWMTKAASVAGGKTTITDDSSYGTLVDGVCLKCHRSNTGNTVGVGYTF